MDYFGTTLEDTAAAAEAINQHLDEEDVHYTVTDQKHFPFAKIYTFPDDIVHMVVSANSLITPKNIALKMLVEVPEPLASKLESIGSDTYYFYDAKTGCLEHKDVIPVDEVQSKIAGIIAPFFEIQGIPGELTEISSKLREILNVMNYTESDIARKELIEDAVRVHGELYLKCREIGFSYGNYEELIKYYYNTRKLAEGKEIEE